MKVEQEITTKITRRLKLTGQDIIDLVSKKHPEFFPNSEIEGMEISASASITVPGGGDWSGETIELDDKMVVTVTMRSEHTKS